MDINYKSIGLRIRAIRIHRGLSQEMLAEFADTSQVYISNIERGEKLVSLKTVVLIANALHTTTDVILADNLSEINDSPTADEFNLLDDCSEKEMDIIISTVEALKDILRGYSIT